MACYTVSFFRLWYYLDVILPSADLASPEPAAHPAAVPPPPPPPAVPVPVVTDDGTITAPTIERFLLGMHSDRRVSDLIVRDNGQLAWRRLGAWQRNTQPAEAYFGANWWSDFCDRVAMPRAIEGNAWEGIPSFGSARFRVCANRYLYGTQAVLRTLASRIPEPEEILLPPKFVDKFLGMSSGLVVLFGVTGSGKSTSIASLLTRRATRPPKGPGAGEHWVTMEDPVEYVLPNDRPTIITQRSLGSDFPSFADALKTVLRSAPDGVFVGELRDDETAKACMSAASSGHVVVTTLHAATAGEAVDRLIVMMGTVEAQANGRHLLSTTDLMLCGQKLIPHPTEHKRVPIHEVCWTTPALSNFIKENKTRQFPQVISGSRAEGMQEFSHALEERCDQEELPNSMRPKVNPV